jgi:hypothetical protein
LTRTSVHLTNSHSGAVSRTQNYSWGNALATAENHRGDDLDFDIAEPG